MRMTAAVSAPRVASLPAYGAADGADALALRMRVRRLEADLEARDEEIRRLRLDLEPGQVAGHLLGLTPKEATFLAVLMARRVAHFEAVEASLYGLDDGSPESNVYKVFVCRIRAKLAAYGVEVETIRGIGWRLPAESKARLHDVVAALGGA